MKDIDAYFTEAQVSKLLTNAGSRRNYMLILILWRTGRRISEVLRLKKKDVDFEKGLVRFYILKKKKEYVKLKPIDQDLLNQIKNYTKDMEWQSYIFPSPYVPGQHLGRIQSYNIIRKAANLSGYFEVGKGHHPHPHMLRHSFAIHFLRNCKSPTIAIKLLQMMLEHSDIRMTTDTYLQFSQDDIRKELNHIFRGE